MSQPKNAGPQHREFRQEIPQAKSWVPTKELR